MNKFFFTKFFFILNIFIFGYLLIINGENQPSYSKVGEYHLNSFKPKINKEQIKNCIDFTTGVLNKNKLQEKIQKEYITPRKYTEIILNLFGQTEKKDAEKILAQTSNNLIQNLEILCGEHDTSSYLLSKINRTTSYSGRTILAKMLIEPTTDTQELKRRQTIIKSLINNKEIFNSLDKTLTDYAPLEKKLLDFFKEKELNKLFGSENYFPNMFWHFTFILNLLPKDLVDDMEIDKTSELINKNEHLLNIMNFYSLWCKGKETYTHFTKGLMTHLKLAAEEFKLNKTKSTFLLPMQLLFGSGLGQYYAGNVLGDARYIYTQIKEERRNYALLKESYEKLKNISSIITNLENIKKITDQDIELKNNISCFKDVSYLFENKSSKSNVFDAVIKNLKTKSFTEEKRGKPPFLKLFLLKGKILSTAYLLIKTQIYLIDFIKAIGKIDCYLSIAKLYNESDKNNAKYCFAQYIKDNKAYINLENFWTPFIPADKVVTNNIKLGGGLKTKCGLISGPNAGGKSTILKSIILNALLAQTITIAPASKCQLTPFTYLDTYLNITDDISSGNSLFKSEVLRVKNMLNKIELINKNKGKSIIIVDEMFSGTNPKEGGSASYAIAKSIAQTAYKNQTTISIMASHYSEMTKLEQDTNGLFKNYKVSVEIDENNKKLSYPFKLLEGISNQFIAINILQSEGFSPEIINNAKKMASQ